MKPSIEKDQRETELENTYEFATNRMFELIERDHSGCDDEDCSLKQLLDDPNASLEETIHWWACSGAADKEFNELYDDFGNEIKELLEKNK